jgi:predicted  nucleic acid-binding Zn-ribbon protein
MTTAQAGFPTTAAEGELDNDLDRQRGKPTARCLHPAISAFIIQRQQELVTQGQAPSMTESRTMDLESEWGTQEECMESPVRNKDATEDIGEKARQLEVAKKAIASKEGNLQSKKGELEKIIAETEKEETQYNKQSATARANVDERILVSYDRIRKNYRNGLAVVAVERDSCGGCFHAIPPQKQSEIKLRKKVTVCENCGRILVDTDLNDSVVIK